MTHPTPTDGLGAWQKFICPACGYIYDEAVGDLESGLPAGTRFKDIPDEWRCPLCGTKKSDFEPYDDTQEKTTTTFKSKDGIVIIGAGLAGWSVVEAVRALDKDVPITLICGDSGDRYHKPMLSVAISQQKTPNDLIRMSAVQSANDHHVRLLDNTTVLAIDVDTKRLHTTQGVVCYDDLVLAIGATLAYPPTIDPQHTWHLNHLSGFAGLHARLSTGSKNIAVVGAGMVGTEFAEDLVKAGHQVSLIDTHAYPLASLLPVVAGERILTAIQKAGVQWLGQNKIQQMTTTTQGHELTLHDSTNHQHTLVFDEIVVATGLLVDEKLPSQAGLAFDKRTGIVVNPTTLRTSVPHIYALGDCIGIDGVPCRYVAPHRPQATAIAHEILGLPHAGYAHKPPMIRLKNKCINVTANGNPKAMGDWQVVSQTDNELILSLHDNGQQIATATLKTP